MFCTSCGKSNADGAKFCSGCGRLLVSNNIAHAPSVNSAYVAAPTARNYYPLIGWLILLLSFLDGNIAWIFAGISEIFSVIGLVRSFKAGGKGRLLSIIAIILGAIIIVALHPHEPVHIQA